jgi:hypothetical protein
MARSDFSSLERYIPDESSREAFRKLLAYKDNLAAEDELAKIIEAMGLFSLIATTIPARLIDATAQLTQAMEQANRIPQETAKALDAFKINNERLEEAAAVLAEQGKNITNSFDNRNGWIAFLIFVIGFLSGILAMRIFF